MDENKTNNVVKKSSKKVTKPVTSKPTKKTTKTVASKTTKPVTKKVTKPVSKNIKDDKIKKVIITKKNKKVVKKEVKETIIPKEETKVEEVTPIKNEKKHNIIKLIFDILFWVLISILAFVWLFDFVMVKNSKEPKFCLSKYEEKFDDGTVSVCRGFGYNIYEYNRMSVDIKTAFCPFFIQMKK